MEETKSTPIETASNADRAWIGYVVPTAVYMGMTWIEGQFPHQYVWLYMLKAALVTVSLIFCRSTLKDYRFDLRALLPALVVGLFIFAIWIPLDKVTPFHLTHSGRSVFDPWKAIPDAGLRTAFLIARFYGLVIMVPVVEELFWRSFLLRFLSNLDGDFRKIPMGTFSWSAFWIVSGIFALGHPEWLSALVCGICYALLLRGTRSLFAALVAHSITNLALGIYIVQSHAWKYW